MKRERATRLVEGLLERVARGGKYLSLVDEVWVFGSYARGALEPHDVDVDVELTEDEEYREETSDALVSGRDWNAPMRRALLGRERGIQLLLRQRETHERADVPMTLLWRRGDTLDAAVARLHAIAPDPEAGRAPRDAMLPAFEGLDRWVPRPLRVKFTQLVEAGALEVEQLVLADAEPRSRTAMRHIDGRWQERSPLRRAAMAAVAHIEQQGGDPLAVHLHGIDIKKRRTPHFVGFKWYRWGNIPWAFTEWHGEQWLEVPRVTRTKPLFALRIIPVDWAALDEARPTWQL